MRPKRWQSVVWCKAIFFADFASCVIVSEHEANGLYVLMNYDSSKTPIFKLKQFSLFSRYPYIGIAETFVTGKGIHLKGQKNIDRLHLDSQIGRFMYKDPIDDTVKPAYQPLLLDIYHKPSISSSVLITQPSSAMSSLKTMSPRVCTGISYNQYFLGICS